MNFGVIVAGGNSTRMGPKVDKAFLSLGTRPVLAYSVLAFEHCQDIDGIVLVVRKDRVEAARGMVQLYGCAKVKKIVAGGAQRQVSVAKGLEQLGPEVKVVAVHDGARPCITPGLVSETIQAAKRYGSGVAAVKITDTVKHVERGLTVTRTVSREKLWAVQTPQAFKVDVLQKAFKAVRKKSADVTDEASALELIGEQVRLVPSSMSNIKITTPDDLVLAAALLKI
ncbi:MAG: 2-C-methyl-D-erythritol 4-phosphate cytidylyltransferase [Lentisphaerae bacterium]|nr:2-C-methyl-D-erythritol 4-phosphate cytidylyltransferase [Lentisphaerota bacterium]